MMVTTAREDEEEDTEIKYARTDTQKIGRRMKCAGYWKSWQQEHLLLENKNQWKVKNSRHTRDTPIDAHL